MFKFSWKETRLLERYLHGLVRRAGEIIEEAFPEHQTYEGDLREPHTTKRANFDGHGCITYFKLPDKLPWTEDEITDDPTTNQNAVAGISVADISSEWLHALVQHYAVASESA